MDQSHISHIIKRCIELKFSRYEVMIERDDALPSQTTYVGEMLGIWVAAPSLISC